MKPAVEKLSDDDLIAIAAYVASRQPLSTYLFAFASSRYFTVPPVPVFSHCSQVACWEKGCGYPGSRRPSRPAPPTPPAPRSEEPFDGQ